MPRTALPPLAALLIALAAGLAAAQESSVSLTSGGTSGEATADNPVTRQASTTLAASLGVSDALTLDLAAAGTRIGASSPEGARWGSSGATVWGFSGGLAWSATDHLTLGLTLGATPSSTLDVGTQVEVGDAWADALVRTRASSRSWGLSAGYSSGGSLPHGVTLGVTRNDIDIEQSLQELDASAVAGGTQEVLKRCAKSHSAACRALTGGGTTTTLETAPRTLHVRDTAATLTYSGTPAKGTDLAVELTRHSYSGDDPNAVGYFGAVTIGRTTAATSTATTTKTLPATAKAKGVTTKTTSTGAGATGAATTALDTLDLVGGIPLGPPRTSITAGLGHRWGALRLGVIGGWEDYAESTARTTALGATASYDLVKGWAASLTVARNRSTDDGGYRFDSTSAALGVSRSF